MKSTHLNRTHFNGLLSLSITLLLCLAIISCAPANIRQGTEETRQTTEETRQTSSVDSNSEDSNSEKSKSDSLGTGDSSSFKKHTATIRKRDGKRNYNSGITNDSDWVVVSLDQQRVSPIEVADIERSETDHSSAVDDELWRQLELAGEYYSMGLVANQNGTWDEAQYYFERSLKLLGALDIYAEGGADSVSAEWIRYNNLLENIVASYNVTLLSLGKLPADISPSAVIEKFANVELALIDRGEITEALSKTVVTYDLPIKFNDRVQASIRYFQTDARDAFLRYWSRSTRYIPMLKEIVRSYGLPEDLIYMPMVESGYNPAAYSWAKAVGLWQFISSTGRLYGLKRSWWYDERRDPVKATHAACKYLKWLYKEFGDWELAMAAYNAGPGKVRRTMKRDRTKNYWKLRHLKRETRNYVPLIMAATIISKDPEKYGFSRDEVTFAKELDYDVVTTKKCLDLKTIARSVGSTEKELIALNPELLRKHTPPKAKSWKIKIPKGKVDQFRASYASMKSPKETSWVRHKIKRGETISTIAARYGVSQYAVRDANNMGRRSRIYAGKSLIVPVPLDGVNAFSRRSQKRQSSNGVYLVRGGDSIYEIARSFGVSMRSLKNLNNIGSSSRIYVGQRLRIPGKSSKRNTQTYAGKSSSSGKSVNSSSARVATLSDNSAGYVKHKVRRGENLTLIARKYGVSVSRLKRWNKLGSSAMIFPGQYLKVQPNSNGGGSPSDTYTVKRGDSLWKIAKKYGVSITRLRAWNDLSANARLKPGQKLAISSTRAVSRSNSKYVWHTVRRGENLSSIATRYRTSVRKLMRDNNIRNASRISVGLRLKVFN